MIMRCLIVCIGIISPFHALSENCQAQHDNALEMSEKELREIVNDNIVDNITTALKFVLPPVKYAFTLPSSVADKAAEDLECIFQDETLPK